MFSPGGIKNSNNKNYYMTFGGETPQIKNQTYRSTLAFNNLDNSKMVTVDGGSSFYD